MKEYEARIMQMSGIQEEEEKENAKKENLKRDTELVKVE